jgi:hypothetical protein
MNAVRRLVVATSAAMLMLVAKQANAAVEEAGNCPDCFQANIVWWNNCMENAGDNLMQQMQCNSAACNSLFTNCNRWCDWASYQCPFY